MKLLASLQSKRVFVPKTAKSTCSRFCSKIGCSKALVPFSDKGVLDEAKPAALSGQAQGE